MRASEADMKVLYFTHCCAKKDDTLKGTGKKVPPIKLYTAIPTRRFMKKCSMNKVAWAIFSDKHAFVFPNNLIEWYNKHPNSLTDAEKKKLFDDAFEVLKNYDLVWFYYNPGRLHSFYRELVNEMRRRNCSIREITHLVEISWSAYMNEKLEPVLKRMDQQSSMVIWEYFSKFIPNGATNIRFFSYGSNMNEGKFREDTREKGHEFGLIKAEKRVLQGYKRDLGNSSVRHGLAFTILLSKRDQIDGICHDVPIEGLEAFLSKEGVLSKKPSYELLKVSIEGENYLVLTLKGLRPSKIKELDWEKKLKTFCYVRATLEGTKRWNINDEDILEIKERLEKELCKSLS